MIKQLIISLDDDYLLGVLNSKVSDFTLHSLASTKRGGYFEYKPVYVSKIPIPTATPAQAAAIEERVAQILSAKKADPSADTTALEAEIDALVYQLYGLTADEIALVEGA